MSAQGFVVALVVSASAAYAAWTLMPAAARRGVARWLLRRGWPALIAAPLQRSVNAGSGCQCDGCDKSAAGAAAMVKPIQIHRRPPR